MRFQMAAQQGDFESLLSEVPEGLTQARTQMIELIERAQNKLEAKDSSLVLGGFSQGSMLALDIALRTNLKLSSLILMSSTLIAKEEWLPLMSARKGLPVLISHGRQDSLLPFAVAEGLKDLLINAGMDVSWVPFDGEHGIAPEVLHQARQFIQHSAPEASLGLS